MSDVCKHCGMHDGAAAEIRARLRTARHRSSETKFGQACAAMVPFYERALAALEEASAEWDKRFHAMSRPAPVPPGETRPVERDPVLPWVLRPNGLWDAPCPCGSTLVNYTWLRRVEGEDYHALGCDALAALRAAPAAHPETTPKVDHE